MGVLTNNIIEAGIEDILHFNQNVKSFDNQLVVEIINGQDAVVNKIKDDIPVRLDALSMFIVFKGNLNINIDGKNYWVKENSVMHISDLHILKRITISDDLEAYHVIIDRNLFSEIMRFNRRIPDSCIASLHERPIHSISPSDSLNIKKAVEKIMDSIDRSDFKWRADLIKNDLRGFMLEMSNVVYKAYKKHNNFNGTGKDTLFLLFLQLLRANCKVHHDVKFYAAELGIDPSYLSRILKQISGKSTVQWICDAVLREAELLLSTPDNTIQHVSDELNFSDQSAFGKFFKKHKGVSPAKFQKENALPQ